MAEAKKEEKKPVFTPGSIFAELIGLIILLYFVNKFLTWFNSDESIAAEGRFSSFEAFFDSFGVGDLFSSTVSTYIFFISLLSMLFIVGIIYILFKLHALEKAWKASLYPDESGTAVEKPKNERWARVLAHIYSDNPSDWRLAILESDIILDDVLDRNGFVGATIGDKLKTADPAQFQTLNNAWEAHKIRNAIAHEGQDFTLTHREARRIVGLYESVFLEFDYI
jgi:hypothetical protein